MSRTINMNELPDKEDAPLSDENYEPIPEGKYLFVIQQCEEKESAQKTCRMFCNRLQVAEGEHAGRLVFDNMVYEHPTSEKAELIGKARLKAYMQSLSILTINAEDAHKCVGQLLIADVTQKPNKRYGGMQNQVTDYEPYNVKRAATPPPQKSQAAPPQQAQGQQNFPDDDIPF